MAAAALPVVNTRKAGAAVKPVVAWVTTFLAVRFGVLAAVDTSTGATVAAILAPVLSCVTAISVALISSRRRSAYEEAIRVLSDQLAEERSRAERAEAELQRAKARRRAS